jgi:hypothetical protein
MGPHTVTFVTVTQGTVGRVGPTPTTSQADVSGCFMQPLSVNDVITETEVETELWRCLAPPVTAAVNVKTEDEIIFNGDTFQVIGAKPFYSFASLDHITIDLRIQRG